jgi:hypothetical protein
MVRLPFGDLLRDVNAVVGIFFTVGTFWGFVAGLCILWGLVAVITEQVLTHQWQTKKTLIYTLLGSFFIIGGAVAYKIYGDELRNSVFQNLNAEYPKIAAHQQVGVQSLKALSLLMGTAENPIQLCRSDTALLKVEALLSDEVIITFLGPSDRELRDAIRLRVGGQYVEVMDDGTRLTEDRDVWEMSEPLDLQKLLVSGLNRLHFYVGPDTDPANVMALVVRLLHGDMEQVLRISYVHVDIDNRGDPVTDIYFNLTSCNAR